MCTKGHIVVDHLRIASCCWYEADTHKHTHARHIVLGKDRPSCKMVHPLCSELPSPHSQLSSSGEPEGEGHDMSHAYTLHYDGE